MTAILDGSNIILKRDHPRTIKAKFGYWISSFRGGDFEINLQTFMKT